MSVFEHGVGCVGPEALFESLWARHRSSHMCMLLRLSVSTFAGTASYVVVGDINLCW